MKFLITGASGFVGQHLVRTLTLAGHDVSAWGLTPSEGNGELPVDLLVADQVRSHDLRDLDAVIHLAGLAQVSESFADPVRYLTANPTMQAHLMEVLIEQRCLPKVLIVSSGSVYGAQNCVITEQSLPDPGDPYAISKLTQELLGSYYAKRGFEVVVARPFNHIGPGQQRGYLVSDLASQIAALERAGGGELSVGNLTSTRDYTDVRDVTAAYAALIRSGHPGEIYNVCSGSSHSGEEIAGKLISMADAPITVARDRKRKRQRPTDANHVRASNDKLRKDTGWTPTIALDSTLADVLDDWRRRE